MPQHIWGRFVWSWLLCSVHYDNSLDSIVSVLHTGNMIQLLTHVSYGFLAKNHAWSGSPVDTYSRHRSSQPRWAGKNVVGKVMWIHHLVCRCGCTCDQRIVFHSTWDKFCLGGLAKGANATPVLHTYYGDTTAQSQYKDSLAQVWGLPC